MDNLSATGENPNIPNMTKATQDRHKKHLNFGKSYPNMTMSEYVQKSGKLARSEVGGDVLGYKSHDGAIVRYNRTTNDWVKAYPAGVASMYKPTRGETYYYDVKRDDELK